MRSSIRKLFKEIVGIAPGEYFIQSRINVAKAMLLENRGSIKEIAIEFGFTDPFAFSKQFKKQVGVSPIEFKRKW